MKKPIILATLADDRANPQFVKRLVAEGMKGVRFNSAHASPDEIVRLAAMVRAVDAAQIILVDTKGAEVRTTALSSPEEEILLPAGAEIVITDGGREASTARSLCITASGICNHAREGMEVLVDDGEIALTVERVEQGHVACRVVKEGLLGSRKTVCFRGIELNALPAVTDRDRAAIEASVSAGADIIAHSFVRSAADVEAVRELIPPSSHTRLYAKIECREAVENMESILAAADGLLCARGDLGASVGIEHVPAVEMQCIAACRNAGKPLMLATQLMQSMMTQPQPTRAEAVDIAFAVKEQIDSLLLTGETARGNYPVECVAWMRRIVDATSDYLSAL